MTKLWFFFLAGMALSAVALGLAFALGGKDRPQIIGCSPGYVLIANTCISVR